MKYCNVHIIIISILQKIKQSLRKHSSFPRAIQLVSEIARVQDVVQSIFS